MERERDGEAAAEQAALLAAVCTELMVLANDTGLLVAEVNSGALQRAVDRLKAVCADLADYTAARTGQLALSRSPVNVHQLLSRIAARHAIDLRVSADVPERMEADENLLARLLGYFVEQNIASGARILEVQRESGSETLTSRVVFSVRPMEASLSGESERPLQEPSPLGKLHAALVVTLCELLGGSHTATCLTLPLQSAEDQAHTGIFRLAVSEQRVDPVAIPAADRALDHESAASGDGRNDDCIDLGYLDRQLGSLAPVILARTAPAFIAEAQRRMTDLHVAHESADVRRLHGIVQTWKGSALTVGARKLAALFGAIDQQTALGILPSAGAIWQVRSALDRTLRALASHSATSARRT
ncbi:MAG: hypothetical protein WB646_10955 [Steroidobacteraceae bacterium]